MSPKRQRTLHQSHASSVLRIPVSTFCLNMFVLSSAPNEKSEFWCVKVNRRGIGIEAAHGTSAQVLNMEINGTWALIP